MELLISMRRSTLGIALFAAVTAGVIAVTQVMTRERISQNQQEHQARALYEILPRELDDQLHRQSILISAPELGFAEPITVYQSIQNNEVEAVILPAIAPDGYSGDIRMLVGIWRDGRVAGVRVLEHKETPGLGDKVELAKSNWILSFDDKAMDSSNDPRWRVRKDGGDFDQFTGATITPRAVVRAVARTVQFYESRRPELLTPATEQDAHLTVSGDES
ncbi:electron transport complex subunit RsxG [Nitrincola alkalilacustris]|uniref:electron transport complex subunit RsxG n=1 Tax=Nitrincola alkalilacustris TaxID=1571224 RepID=UPI00124D6C57|nr:electron transport complex subunit RsxG [Nitrincola alkalilacustris]